jgi:hypothetical protein
MFRKFTVVGAALVVLGGAAAVVEAREPDWQRVPDNAIQLRLGYFAPSGGGTLWEDVEQRFTLSGEDFDGGAWGLSFVGGINRHFEVGVNADWYQQTVRAEDRDFVDQFGFPIVHDTTLSQFPLAVDLRLVPFGRRPGKPVFYVGAGAGVNFWRYREAGDFVDEGDPDLPIFYGVFEERGQSLESRLLAGLEFPLTRAFNLTFEGRYSFAESDLDAGWAGSPTIDRGGAWMFVGASLRF